ncbi:MAG: 2-oxoacid:acceptor oxidoreductase family protein [Desulfobacterales bacterium]|nr:2-oxoacid:acceptor oxidoreductase family protein [Desulfobacterales bacterium]MBF0398014.1 2-oxoacid:acceptor oxidoreductase family protein [Desulfobacterales bacterium]
MRKDIIEIRWHGRGGQGAVTAAKIVANAAFNVGYRGVLMMPTFGTERRGAPVVTFLKLSKEKIYDISPIEKPDMVVVLDHLIIEEVSIIDDIKPGGFLIVNTPKPVEAYKYNGLKVAVADVTKIACEAGLQNGIVNSGIIGAFAKASGLVDIEALVEAIKYEFKERKPIENALAASLTYDKTVIGDK